MQLHDYSDEQQQPPDAMEAEARRLFPPSSTVFCEHPNLKSAVQEWQTRSVSLPSSSRLGAKELISQSHSK
jgi:hypothetical protein